jgi:hypothetical protein
MTRGRCGSLLLHRDGLAPSTPCRSPGARFPNLPSLATSCVCLELRLLPSTGITPASSDTTGLSATPPRPACPSRDSGWSHARPRDGASRVASVSLFHACHRHYPGGITGCTLRSLPLQCQPSLSLSQVGFRHIRFEACSAFTHVTACMLAESLTGPFTPEASTASLPPQLLQLLPAEAKVAGRDSHPLRNSALSRRTQTQGWGPRRRARACPRRSGLVAPGRET